MGAVSSCCKTGEPQGVEGGIPPHTVSAQLQLWSAGDNWGQPLPPAVVEGFPTPQPTGPLPLLLGRWGRSAYGTEDPAQLGKDKTPISCLEAHCASSQLSQPVLRPL